MDEVRNQAQTTPAPPAVRTADSPRPPRTRLAAILIAVSGAGLAVGSFLTWSGLQLARGRSGKGAKSATLRGLQLLDGKLALGTGVALVVLGLLVLILRGHQVRLGALVTSLALGVVTLTVALSSLGSTPGRSALGALRPRLAERLQSSWGPGFYVALAAGILGIGAAALGLVSVDRRPQSEAVA